MLLQKNKWTQKVPKVYIDISSISKCWENHCRLTCFIVDTNKYLSKIWETKDQSIEGILYYIVGRGGFAMVQH